MALYQKVSNSVKDDSKSKNVTKKKKKSEDETSSQSKKLKLDTENKEDNRVVDEIEMRAENSSMNESIDSNQNTPILTAYVYFMKSLNEDHFKQFLSSHKIKYKEIRLIKKRRMCYVDFDIENELMKFLSLDKSKISDIELSIKRAIKKLTNSGIKAKLEDKVNRRLFMKNFPLDITVEELKNVFSSATSIKLPKRSDNSLKGYGYLTFPDEETANEILIKLQNVIVKGKAIKLSKLKNIEKNPSTRPNIPTCLLVKQLSFSITKEVLKKSFKKAISARLVLDPKTKKSKGFGFVEFENEDDAKEAMKEMQGKELEGRQIVISNALKKITPNRAEKKINKKKGNEERMKKQMKKNFHKEKSQSD